MSKNWTQVLQDRAAGLVPGFAGNEAVDLESMTKAQLLAEADARGVDVDDRATKAEIRAALEA